MKHLKNFKIYEYTQYDVDKDYRRVEDMWTKSGYDMDKMVKLATTMAGRITNGEKARNRGNAAEDLNFHEVAKIFFERAEELGY